MAVGNSSTGIFKFFAELVINKDNCFWQLEKNLQSFFVLELRESQLDTMCTILELEWGVC